MASRLGARREHSLRHECGGGIDRNRMEVVVDVALPPDVLRMLDAVRTARDALDPDDPRRSTMEQFLTECTKLLSSDDRIARRPRLPAQRRDFVGTKAAPRADSREAAYTAMEALLSAAWPTMSTSERQARKRQKQRHHAAAVSSTSTEPEPAPMATEGAAISNEHQMPALLSPHHTHHN